MYYKQPKYFNEFQCVGSKCIDNCCYGWDIDWDEPEIDKVLNAENISSELRELIENSFKQDKNNKKKFIMQFGEDGKCPFQTEDNLCKIQKELGAEYLSRTCKEYPRTSLYTTNQTYRYCHMTCPVITEKLLNDEACMGLVSIAPQPGSKINALNRANDINKYPIQAYRAEIFEFFYELISDKKNDVESAVILGALAASALTKIQEREDFDSIPEQLKNLRKQLHDGNMLKSLDNIKPNYQIKFGFLPKITEEITGRTATFLLHDDNNNYYIKAYELGEQRLRETLQGRGYFLRNVALNLLLELDVPFRLSERTIFENYSLFVTVFACVKLNLIGAMATDRSITMHTQKQEFCYEGDGKLIGLTALICRGLCQSKYNSGKIIDLLKQNGYDRPAYLALLVK